MHRLRVISFDKVLSEKENDIGNSKKKLKRHHDYKTYHKTVSTHKKKPQRPKTNTSTNTDIKVAQKDNYRSRALKKISYASMSELFSLHTKGNILKRFSSIKTISLDDIRKTLISNVYGNKRQNKHNQCHKNNATSKKTVQKRCVESQDDIKVLYSFERSKSPDNGKMDCVSKKNPKKSNYLIRRTSSDIFGIGKIRQNTYLCFHTTRNTGLLPTPKKRNKRTESTPHILHAAYPNSISIPNRKPKKLRFQNKSTSDHYNIVCYPRRSKLNVGDRFEPLGYSLKGKKVAPSPSSALIAFVDHKGDTDKCVCTSVNKMITESSAEPITEKQLSNPNNNKYVTEKDRSSLKVLKSILKYLMIAICITVWLPCILVMAVCWLIIYLLKPRVLKDDKITENQPTSTAKYATKSINKNIFTRIMNFNVKTSQRLYAMSPPLMFKEEGEPPKSPKSIFSTPSQIEIKRRDHETPPKWEPNPEKRYILFCDDERGWLMKPLRCEDGEESLGVKRPKVVQNFRFDCNLNEDCNLYTPLPRSNRAVTFSKTVQERKTTNEYDHICDCPPSTSVKTTQAKFRETRPPKGDKFESPIDINSNSVKKPDKKKAKKSKLVSEPDQEKANNSKPVTEPDHEKAYNSKLETEPDQKKAYNSKPETEPDQKMASNSKPETKSNKKKANNSKPETEPDQKMASNSKPETKSNKKKANNSKPVSESDQKKDNISKTETEPDQNETISKKTETEPDQNDTKRKKTSSATRPCKFRPPTMRVPCSKRKKLAQRTKSQLQSRIKTRATQREKCQRCRLRQYDSGCIRKVESKYQSQTVPYKYTKKRLGQRFCDKCKCCAHNLKDVVDDAECAWGMDNCQDMYLYTLRNRPCFWIYDCCRSLYPAFLTCHRACCNLCFVLLTLLAILVWCPCFIFCYLCLQLFCGHCNC